MKNNYIKMVSDCILFIEDNLKNKVTVEDVLNKTYYSYPHLYRIFMDVVGDSITGYIQKRKLSCAALDLVTSQKLIVEIALDYGFSSQQTFNRAFTNMFMIPPQRYREKGLLDDIYKTFEFAIQESPLYSSISVSIEKLPPMKVAVFHSYNNKISSKNQFAQQDRVVSKAWEGLIEWQMTYEYQKYNGSTDKLPGTRQLGEFIVDNNLHVPPNTRYFGFISPFPFCNTEFGYEAWAMLENDSKDEPLFIDHSKVGIKDIPEGLYAVAEATYGKDSNLDETWKKLHYWIAENDKYEYGEHPWLEEHVTKANIGGFHSFKLFMAIKPIDH